MNMTIELSVTVVAVGVFTLSLAAPGLRGSWLPAKESCSAALFFLLSFIHSFLCGMTMCLAAAHRLRALQKGRKWELKWGCHLDCSINDKCSCFSFLLAFQSYNGLSAWLQRCMFTLKSELTVLHCSLPAKQSWPATLDVLILRTIWPTFQTSKTSASVSSCSECRVSSSNVSLRNK